MPHHFSTPIPGIDADALRLSATRAHSLLGKFGFSSADFHDLQQDLLVAALSALQRYDAARGRKLPFIRCVLFKKSLHIVRDFTRQKRNRECEAFSLDAPLPPSECEFDGETHGEVIEDRSDCTWRCLDVIIDVRDALATLPPRLRALAQYHAEMRPDAARRTAGMAKATHSRAMRRIRQHFARIGILPSPKKSGTFGGTTGNLSSSHL